MRSRRSSPRPWSMRHGLAAARRRRDGGSARSSVEETLRLLGEYGSEATLLAGGQSLMILLRQGLVVPELLIGLKRVEELRTVEPRGGGLRLGSMVTYRTAAADPRIAGSLPPLGAAARSVG